MLIIDIRVEHKIGWIVAHQKKNIGCTVQNQKGRTNCYFLIIIIRSMQSDHSIYIYIYILNFT